MRTSSIILSTLIGALSPASAIPHSYHDAPPASDLSIETSSGHINGKIDPATPHVRQFLGVPYAQPPLGALRFAPPAKVAQSAASNVVNATELPAACLQFLNTEVPAVYLDNVLEFGIQGLNRTAFVSEDCLTLSVWTPTPNTTQSGHDGNGKHKGKGKDAELLPVFIFLPGGGFSVGGTNVPYQLPPQWVERTRDHVVITINYRLNLFGFPNAAGLSQENLGILDQRAAVEWAQQNVQAFGGDPKKMTLWGQSAGAISVDILNFAYYDNPIVDSLIMDSGTALLPLRSTDFTHSNFSFVAANVGCGGLENEAAAQLSCMRNVSALTLENFVQQYEEAGTAPGISFVPVVDNVTIFSNYTDRALKGLQSKIPAIIGTNAQDGVPFAPYHANGPNATLAELALLSTFFCPATESIRLRQATGFETFRYIYAGNFSNVSPVPWLGAYHCSELPLIFGTYADFRGPATPLEVQTSVAMQDAWVAFAKDGAAGLQGTGWGEYATLGEDDVREFGHVVVAQNISVSSLESMCNGAMAAAA